MLKLISNIIIDVAMETAAAAAAAFLYLTPRMSGDGSRCRRI